MYIIPDLITLLLLYLMACRLRLDFDGLCGGLKVINIVEWYTPLTIAVVVVSEFRYINII